MSSSHSHHGIRQGSSRLALLFVLALSTPISVLQHASSLGAGSLVRGDGGSSPYNPIASISGPHGRAFTLSTFMTSAVCSKTTARWLYSSSWILLSSLPGLMAVESAPVTIPDGGINVSPDPVVVGGVLGGGSGSGGKKSSPAGSSPSPSNTLPSPSSSSSSSSQSPPTSPPSSTSPFSGTNTPNVPVSPQGPSGPVPNPTNGSAGGSRTGTDDNCSSAGAVLVSCSFGPDASQSGSSSSPLGGDWPPPAPSSSNTLNSNDHNSNSNDSNPNGGGGIGSGTQISITSIKVAIISIVSVAALIIVILAILIIRRRKQVKQQREEEQASFNAYGAYHSGKSRRLRKTDQHVGLNSFCSTDTRCSAVPLRPLEQFWNP